MNPSMLNDKSEAQLKRAWLAVAFSRALRKRPLSVTVMDKPVVLVRLGDRVSAFLDVCPHRGVPLSKGRVLGERLQCGYHGFEFDADGSCTKNPASESPPKCTLTSLACRERDDLIWVCFEGANQEPPRFEYHNDPSYRVFDAQADIQGNLFDALENFLDATHTHFIHKNLIRRESKRREVTVELNYTEAAAEARYLDEGASSGWIQQLFAADIVEGIGRFRPPNIAELDYVGPRFLRLRIVLIFTPSANGRLCLLARLYAKHPLSWLLFWIIRPFFKVLLRQDERVLKQLQDHGHPRRRLVYTDVIGEAIISWLMTGKIKPKIERRKLLL